MHEGRADVAEGAARPLPAAGGRAARAGAPGKGGQTVRQTVTIDTCTDRAELPEVGGAQDPRERELVAADTYVA